MNADKHKIDLQVNKKSTDGSILQKVSGYQNQLRTHDQRRLNILKKAPLCTICDRTVSIVDRFTSQEKKCLMFGSNNYLGVISQNQCIDKAIEVTREYGIGSGGVPLLTGTNIFQNRLETKVAQMKGFDDAILFSSGFTANLGAIIGLVRDNHLNAKIFGVGSLASTCQQHIGIDRNLPHEEYLATGLFISNQIMLKSQELRHKIVFIKEVPDGELSEVRQLLSKDFCFCDSLPNCFVPVYKNGIPYPGKLREKQRYRYRKLKHRFDQRFTWELITDFTFVVDVFERLYLETLSKSGNKFEVLNQCRLVKLKRKNYYF